MTFSGSVTENYLWKFCAFQENKRVRGIEKGLNCMSGDLSWLGIFDLFLLLFGWEFRFVLGPRGGKLKLQLCDVLLNSHFSSKFSTFQNAPFNLSSASLGFFSPTFLACSSSSHLFSALPALFLLYFVHNNLIWHYLAQIL